MADDLEFRPLTEGLGFHKKVIELGDEPEVVQPPPRTTPSEMPPAQFVDKSVPQTAPPRPGVKQPFHPQTNAQNNPNVSAAAARAAQASSLTWRPAASPILGYEQPLVSSATLADERLVPFNWGAALFDSLVVLGLSLIFAALVFTITQVPYSNVITLLEIEQPAQWASAALLFLVYELYIIISRVFFGKTLGEWASAMRLGTIKQQQAWWYPLAVAWRGLVIALTGYILLPLISTISRKDVAGMLSGVHLRSDNR